MSERCDWCNSVVFHGGDAAVFHSGVDWGVRWMGAIIGMAEAIREHERARQRELEDAQYEAAMRRLPPRWDGGTE